MGDGENSVIGKNAQFPAMVENRKDFVLVIALSQHMVVMTVQLTDPVALKRETATKLTVQVSNPQMKKNLLKESHSEVLRVIYTKFSFSNRQDP